MSSKVEESHPPIRTYGRIHGRITSGQRRALDELAQDFLITFEQGVLLDQDDFLQREPLILDLGCGMCDATIQMAQQRPHCSFVGVDVYEPGIARGLMLAKESGLDNVRFIMNDLLLLLQDGLAEASVDEAYVLFPDPWPKKRHHKRRLVRETFLALLRRILKPQGLCVVATDWHEYAEEIAAAFAVREDYENCQSSPDTALQASKFARRGRAEQRPIEVFCHRAV